MWQPYSRVDHTSGAGRTRTSSSVRKPAKAWATSRARGPIWSRASAPASKPHSGHRSDRTHVQFLVSTMGGLSHGRADVRGAISLGSCPADRVRVREASGARVQTLFVPDSARALAHR